MMVTIVKILNVFILALLLAMYIIDPEKGGLPFWLIFFLTILYDIYFWIVYSIVKKFEEKPKRRKWWLLFGALLPFVPIFIIGVIIMFFELC